jgi:hypothetical protein
VDCDGVTGPGAGRTADAAALPAAERLDEIPGLGREAAAALIAEIGLDMSRFPTPQALVPWAGLTPTARQSAAPRAALATGSSHHARNCSHASGLRWLFLGQPARSAELPPADRLGVADAEGVG